MEFAINSASQGVDFVIRSSCDINLIEIETKERGICSVFGGTECILVGYLLIIDEQK